MGMVIVMPALTEGEQRYPPVVAGIVASAEPPPAPHVGHRVDGPGGVEPEYQADTHAPQQEWKTTNSEQHGAEQDRKNPVVGIQINVKRILCQIGSVLGHQLGVIMLGLTDQQPANMRPPSAIVR